jgi:hypothetical protein
MASGAPEEAGLMKNIAQSSAAEASRTFITAGDPVETA